jgi:hypothetical protein
MVARTSPLSTSTALGVLAPAGTPGTTGAGPTPSTLPHPAGSAGTSGGAVGSSLSIAARKGATATHGAPPVRRLTTAAGMIGALPSMPPDQSHASDSTTDSPITSGSVPASAPASSQAFAELAEAGRSIFAEMSTKHQASRDTSREAPSKGPSTAATPAPSPFAALAAESSSRRNLNALKVLARLVAAIARRPGSNAPQALKAESLAQLITKVQQSAQRLALSVAPLDAHRGWVRASAFEAAASIVASQWESDPYGETAPLEIQIEALEAVFELARDNSALNAALEDFSHDAYAQATDETIAASRVELSTRLAAWDLYGHVTSPVLGQGTYRFTYGKKPAEVVALLMPHAVSIARESQARYVTLDVVTTHFQACIRRCADLLGAEYVSRTRALMNYIAQDGITDQEYQQRHAVGCRGLEETILPAVVDSARQNFLAIEALAGRGLEETAKHGEAVDEQPRGR